MSAPILTIDTQHEDMIHDAQLDYYGKRLATCSSDRTIKVYDVTGDVQNNEQILTGHEGPVWQVSWAHPKFGVLLAACSYDGKVIIYREQSLNQWTQAYVHAFHESSVNSIAWAPHEYGLALACASADGTVSVLSYSRQCTGLQRCELGSIQLGGFAGSVRPIRRVVTASCDKTVKIWSLPEGETEWTKQELSSAPAHSDWVRDVAWAPSTGLPVNIIASCSEDKHVYIWSQTAEDSSWKRELLHTFDAPVWRVSWSVTGNVLAVSSGDHKVTLWKETLDKKWIQISSVDEAGAIHNGNE
ncbi:G-protein beta WD-40 repeat [Phytophthora cactorum]|nr:G-protein beta WD-40 repeat [Phytophthora cactorum]